MCLCVAICAAVFVCFVSVYMRVLFNTINAPTCTHYFLNQDSFITVPQVELNPQLPECFSSVFKSEIVKLSDILSIINYQVTQLVEISTEESSRKLRKSMLFWFAPVNLEEQNHVHELLLEAHKNLRDDPNHQDHSSSVSAQLDCVLELKTTEMEETEIDKQKCSFFELFSFVRQLVSPQWIKNQLQKSYQIQCESTSSWTISDLMSLKFPDVSCLSYFQGFIIPASSVEPLQRIGGMLAGDTSLLPKESRNPFEFVPGAMDPSLSTYLASFLDLNQLHMIIEQNSHHIQESFQKSSIPSNMVYQCMLETTESLYDAFGTFHSFYHIQ